MTVLSDEEIKARISEGELVLNGDSSNAEECSYSFRPGRAFLAGNSDHEVNFLQTKDKQDLVVEPGKMVWIRTREQVVMPIDMVGFWWQTNTLARQGLMLVNMSMVEPGYQGDLACLFVNFGNQKVIIHDETIISKMVFICIKGNVDSPYSEKRTTKKYDSILKQLAVNQPSSFLQIGEISANLEKQREQLISDINNAKDVACRDVEKHLNIAKDSAIKQFKEDAPKAIWKTYAFAVGAVVFLGVASTVANWTKNNLFANTQEIARTEALKVMNDKVMISSTPNSEDTARILKNIEYINNRLENLEKSGIKNRDIKN